MLVRKSLIAIGCVFFMGCGHVTPYLEMGMGYEVRGNLHGRNPTAHVEVGLTKGSISCGYNHFSHLRDGRPFNNNWDSFSDTLICKKRWD